MTFGANDPFFGRRILRINRVLRRAQALCSAREKTEKMIASQFRRLTVKSVDVKRLNDRRKSFIDSHLSQNLPPPNESEKLFFGHVHKRLFSRSAASVRARKLRTELRFRERYIKRRWQSPESCRFGRRSPGHRTASNFIARSVDSWSRRDKVVSSNKNCCWSLVTERTTRAREPTQS